MTDTILKAFEACANSHGGMSGETLQLVPVIDTKLNPYQ